METVKTALSKNEYDAMWEKAHAPRGKNVTVSKAQLKALLMDQASLFEKLGRQGVLFVDG